MADVMSNLRVRLEGEACEPTCSPIRVRPGAS